MTTSTTLGGYVRDQLQTPLTLVGGFFRMCVLTGKALFRWPFQWREFILQCWFIMRVGFLPTIVVSIPLTVLLIFTLNILLAQFGAADISGSGAAIGAVTQLGPLTEAFNLMLRALAESRERQARLVTDAGHELRTPLTSLRTNVELLMASMAPGAPRLPKQEMVDLRADVLAQIEELSTLVGDLVDLSRGDAGEVVHEPVDMADVVDRSLERVRRRRNDILFDVEVIGWQVYGDTAGLSRMALNLMDNAAKWSPPGGHVGVRLSQLDASHAELVVSDRGPGIPVQERRLVFERFYRSASARALPGSGLGLAIVKQVVLNHGGLLRIEDTDPGGQPPGTSIYVLLPGRRMPIPQLPGATAGARSTDIENSRGSANVISVESQSTRAT